MAAIAADPHQHNLFPHHHRRHDTFVCDATSSAHSVAGVTRKFPGSNTCSKAAGFVTGISAVEIDFDSFSSCVCSPSWLCPLIDMHVDCLRMWEERVTEHKDNTRRGNCEQQR